LHTPYQSNFVLDCEFCPEAPKHIGAVDDVDIIDNTDEDTEPIPECPARHWDYDLAQPNQNSLRLELQQTKPSRNSARAQAAMHVCWLHVHAFCWCVSTQLPGIARNAKAKSVTGSMVNVTMRSVTPLMLSLHNVPCCLKICPRI